MALPPIAAEAFFEERMAGGVEARRCRRENVGRDAVVVAAKRARA